MAHYRDSVPSSRSRKQTFDYLARFSNNEEWDPGVSEAQSLDGDRVGVGSRFRVVFKIGGVPRELVYRVVDYEAPRRIRLVAEDALLTSDDVIEVDERDGAVSVTYEADVRLKGPLRLFDPVLRLTFPRVAGKARDGLRAALAHR